MLKGDAEWNKKGWGRGIQVEDRRTHQCMTEKKRWKGEADKYAQESTGMLVNDGKEKDRLRNKRGKAGLLADKVIWQHVCQKLTLQKSV